MRWIFIDSSLLTEVDSGFSVRLISGTWSDPIEIKPDKTTVDACDQARLLRLGLEYASNYQLNKIA